MCSGLLVEEKCAQVVPFLPFRVFPLQPQMPSGTTGTGVKGLCSMGRGPPRYMYI